MEQGPREQFAVLPINITSIATITYPARLQRCYCVLSVLAEVFSPIVHYASVIVWSSERIDNGPAILEKVIFRV